MPLSEDEQRILRQIEEHLQRDPGFGRTLHRPSGGSRRRLLLWGMLTVVAVGLTGLIEILQFLAPGRHARLEDFIVDALAACVGLAIAAAADSIIRRKWQTGTRAS